MPIISYTKARIDQLLLGKAASTHSHAPADVGLGNVSNTADAEKPVSTATSTAISSATAGQVRVALWDGTSYKVGAASVTLNNRPGNTYYVFIGGPDPFTLNVGVINGDQWMDAS